MHKIKKQQQQAFFSFFLIIFYCLSLIQALKYEDKKLDLNNTSYTNMHAEERKTHTHTHTRTYLPTITTTVLKNNLSRKYAYPVLLGILVYVTTTHKITVPEL